MAQRIGSLLIRLAVEHGILQDGLSRSEQDVKKTVRSIEMQAKRVADFGKKLGLAIGVPLAALAKSGIDGAIAQRQAVAQVETALASMGNVAGRTSDQLVAAADAMELRSLYDGDVILSQVTTSLLTFGKIAGEQFDRAQQAAIDMAAVLGGEPQAQAIILGKALNEPLKGLTALGKNGTIQKEWIDANRERIAAMIEEGRLAEVQSMILAEVERQYRGQAAAVANQDPYRTFKVILDQIGDTLGEALLPYLIRLRDIVVENREDILRATQNAVQFAGSLVSLTQSLSPLIAGYVSYRVALIAAGAAQTVYVAGMTAYSYAATAATGSTRALTLALVANPFTAVAVAVGTLTAAFVTLANAQAQARTETNNLIASLKAAANARSASFTFERAELRRQLKEEQKKLNDIGEKMAGAGKGATFMGSSSDALQRDFLKQRDVIAEIRRGLRDADQAYEDSGKAAEAMVVPTVQAGSAVQGTAGKIRGLTAAAQPATDALLDLAEALYPERRSRDDMRKLDELSKGAERLASIGIDATEARLRVLGAAGKAKVSDKLLDTKPLVDFGQQMEEMQEQLRKTAEATRTQTVQIAQSFREMAERSLQSLTQLVGAIRSGDFLDILTSAANLLVQIGSSGGFGKSIAQFLNAPKIPGNANGTAYHPGGLMMVGERGPEILAAPRGSRVVPNHELREARGGAGVVNNYYTLPSDEFWGRVDGRAAQMVPVAANMGAAKAGEIAARSGRRRVR